MFENPKQMNELEKTNLTPSYHWIVWKLLKMSYLNVSILAFSTNFCTKNDLSGNTVWFSKTRQNRPFLAFLLNFCPPKCPRSSLRSQCQMRLFCVIFKHHETIEYLRLSGICKSGIWKMVCLEWLWPFKATRF